MWDSSELGEGPISSWIGPTIQSDPFFLRASRVTPDGSAIAVFEGGDHFTTEEDSETKQRLRMVFLSTKDGSVIRKIALGDVSDSGVTFAIDRLAERVAVSRCALGNQGSTTEVRDLTSGDVTWSIPGDGCATDLGSFASDGSLALLSRAGGMRLADSSGNLGPLVEVGSGRLWFDQKHRKALVVANSGENATYWDLDTGAPVMPVPLPPAANQPRPSGVFTAAVFDSDDNPIVLTSGGFIIRWELDPDGQVKELCERFGRNLSEDEWNLYVGTPRQDEAVCDL